MSIFRCCTIILVFLVGTALTLNAQQGNVHVPSKERVILNNRLRTEIDGNNVKTSVFNFLFSGRTGAGQGVPYEWPKNTGRVYVALIGTFLGAEVKLNDGRIQQIAEWPSYHTNPATGGDWNLNPIDGYWNKTEGKIAKSDEPKTWPDSWPDKATDTRDPGWRGSWNGFFGKNQFNADQEMFYRVGDDNYDRFNYTPDTTDRRRKGLGLIADARILAWSQPSVADAVFFIQEIKNDGTKDIPKAAFMTWIADFVGGDGDSQDDSPDFDLILDIAFSFDSDGVSSFPPFQGVFVGCAATSFLETPGNAEDRIDNDGDSPEYDSGPKITETMLAGRGPFPAEIPGNLLDDNHNGLVDEDTTYIPFGTQRGVGYADGVDNNGNGESSSPVVTQQMIDESAADPWNRWPPNPEGDPFWAPNTPFKNESIHLVFFGDGNRLGRKFNDNIDNDGNSYGNLPTVTAAIIDTASRDRYHRYRVPGTNVVLYDVGPEDLGKKYINKDRLSDAGIDEGIDEMNDESRNDGIDNDGDWNPVTDDVGLDGVPNTGDFGEGDGKPTSGAGTPFPGEPNIDKTDVSEADQIGITNVQYTPAGFLNNETADELIWSKFMLPGNFVNPELIPTGEYDLYVSSGFFPLRAGQIERISYAVVFGNASRAGNGRSGESGARPDALLKREKAVLAYSQDYRFAQAPLEPTVTAVAGPRIVNGVATNKVQVTLYWDEKAEGSVDKFLAGLPGVSLSVAKDFEGYKVFRATDPAFEDAKIIRDAYGNPAPWLKPIATFDVKDGIKGLDSIGFNGVKFDLGTDSGLKHVYIDTTVQAGQTYYYCVRAYDKGYLPLRISPTESNLRINVDNVTGQIKGIGRSVAIVKPEAAVAGYIPPSVSKILLTAGSTTGKADYEIVNPDSVKESHRYRITFEDTVIAGRGDAPDTFKTKTFTLADITSSPRLDTLIAQSRQISDTVEQPIIHGFRLKLLNEKFFGLNEKASGWNKDSIWAFDFSQWRSGFTSGQQRPSNYKLVFGSVGVDTSTEFVVRTGTPPLPAIPVNFSVYNTSENRKIKFAFQERNLAGGAGVFSAGVDSNFIPPRIFSDIIIFVEPNVRDSLITTWSFRAKYNGDLRRPRTGDTATIVLSKLFRLGDVFEFTTKSQTVDLKLAKSELDKIKVVPNPYVAAATWEPRNPYTSGRGPRSLHFTHLPQQCTIRIFTVSGELVATIDHNSGMRDGAAEWNLLTRDNLSVAYGIYIYHLDAPGIGEKVGKFAIIK